MKTGLKKLISVIICLIMLFGVVGIGALTASADNPTRGTCGDNLTWEYDLATQILTIRGTGEMTSYLKDTYTSEGKTTAPWKYYYNVIKTIVICDGVSSIGMDAFAGCTGITKITIPDSVTSIGLSAFDGCSGLTSITIPGSVTSIGEDAFRSCTNLESITIPDSVTKIGEDAFCYTGYYNDSSNWTDGVLYIGNHLIKANYSLPAGSYTIKNNTKTIAGKAFISSSQLTEISFPDSVTNICSYAFAYCTGLTSINIPDSVTSIGNYAFKECLNLTHITIGNGVTSIGSSAFSKCSNLTSVNFGTSVTTINDSAFLNCSNLTSVNIGSSVTTIRYSAFSGCTSLATVTLPAGITKIGYDVFNNTAYYNNASNWSDNMLYIGNYLIKGKTDLLAGNKSVKSSTTCIADYALSGCNKIINLNVPASVNYIGDYAFGNVINVAYTGTATGSPWGAKCVNGCVDGNLIYRDSSKAKLVVCCPDASGSVTLPASVDTIEDNAFINCSGITDIYIPLNVTRIGNNAFSGSGIKEVYYEGAVIDKMGISIADGNTKLTDATWHYNSKVSDMPSNPTNPDNPSNPDNPNPPSTDIPEANIIYGNSADNKKTYNYKTTMTFTANVPEGGSVQWYVDGSPASNGSTLTVKEKTNDYTVKVVVTDKNGNKTMDEEQVTIKHGFFDILIWFFVHLFNPGAYDVKQ